MILFRKREKREKDSNLLRILIVLSMPYIAMGLSQNGFLGLLPFVREEFVLTRVQVGYYSTSFFISAAVLAVFTGSIVDKLGPRKSLLLGIGCMSLILMLYGLSPSYQVLLFMAILAGLGLSIITPAVIKGLVIDAPPEKRAVSMGIVHSGYGFGSIAGASLLPLLGESLGWRIAVQAAAAFALLTGLLAYNFYQEQNNSSSILDTPESQRGKQLSFKDNLLSLLVNKPLFRVCVLGIIFGVSEGAVISHFAVFLSEDLNMSRVTAGLGLGTLHFGGIIGLIGWGWISDRLFRGNRRLSLFIIGLTIGAMYLLFGLFLNTPQVSAVTVFVFSFLLGFLALSWSGVYFVVIGEFAGDKQAGIATGLSLSFVRTGILVAPLGFGFIADVKGNYEYSWLLFGVVIIVVSSLFLLRD